MAALHAGVGADGAVGGVAGAVAQPQNFQSHILQGADGQIDAVAVGLHQMGAAEYRPDGLAQHLPDMGHHVENSRVGAAHQHGKTPLHLQRQNLVHSLQNLLLRIMPLHQIQHRRLDHIPILDPLCHQRLHKRNDLIHNIIHHMDGTAVHIQHDIVTIVFILVYHVR